MGVDVFFGLSGYLITALLLAEHATTGRIGFGRFYARRALRLYPALILLLVVAALFYRDMEQGGTFVDYGRNVAASALYIQDFASGYHWFSTSGMVHTWSLGVEEQFYILWPPALLLLLARGRDPLKWAAGFTVVSWALLAYNCRQNGPYGAPSGSFLPWDQFGQLLVGCCAAILLTRWKPTRAMQHPGTGWLLSLAAVALVVVAGKVERYPHLAWEAPAIALVTGAMLLHLHSATSGPRTLLGMKPLAYLGRRSYGFYLFHEPVILVLGYRLHEHMGKAGTTLAEIAVTLALCVLSYRFVELPFLRLKHRRFEPASHRPEPVPT